IPEPCCPPPSHTTTTYLTYKPEIPESPAAAQFTTIYLLLFRIPVFLFLQLNTPSLSK
ncbi:hypothetical protein GE21DRAFT_1233756, partial [Neurospora crassa]